MYDDPKRTVDEQTEITLQYSLAMLISFDLTYSSEQIELMRQIIKRNLTQDEDVDADAYINRIQESIARTNRRHERDRERRKQETLKRKQEVMAEQQTAKQL